MKQRQRAFHHVRQPDLARIGGLAMEPQSLCGDGGHAFKLILGQFRYFLASERGPILN